MIGSTELSSTFAQPGKHARFSTKLCLPLFIYFNFEVINWSKVQHCAKRFRAVSLNEPVFSASDSVQVIHPKCVCMCVNGPGDRRLKRYLPLIWFAVWMDTNKETKRRATVSECCAYKEKKRITAEIFHFKLQQKTKLRCTEGPQVGGKNASKWKTQRASLNTDPCGETIMTKRETCERANPQDDIRS